MIEIIAITVLIVLLKDFMQTNKQILRDILIGLSPLWGTALLGLLVLAILKFINA
jgi:hypothetical protein